MRRLLTLSLAALFALPAAAGGLGSRVFVVERDTGSLAVYDYLDQELLPERITGFDDMHHALMTFSRDLRYGYVATRGGTLSRVDLDTLQRTKDVETSKSSIDIAISQDGATLAVAEYAPGGLTLLDAGTLDVLKRIPAPGSRVTGVVDAPGDRFVCVAMESAEVWIIDAGDPSFPVTHRIPTAEALPYDAMVTPDGRWYVVGHLNSDVITVVDLDHPELGSVALLLREAGFQPGAPVKLPHMASWAVAGAHAFVPLPGEARLAVLDKDSFAYLESIPLRGNPVYAVRSPTGREIWVSFSGEEDDAWIQIIDTETLKVKRSLEVGRKIYHMDFTPRGSHVLVSANKDDKLLLIDANTYKIVDEQTLDSPSGVFGVWRAFQIGL